MEQVSLFDEQDSEYNYLDALNEMINDIIIEKRLPANGLQLNSRLENKQKTYLLQIFEPEYPRNPRKEKPDGTLSPVLLIKEDTAKAYSDCVLVSMKEWQFESTEVPISNISILSSAANKTVRFKKDDRAMIGYIKELALKRLSVYSSAKASFACCSHFVDCSDAGYCVHENTLYATGCSYRHHLDQGHIFYGKNRNID